MRLKGDIDPQLLAHQNDFEDFSRAQSLMGTGEFDQFMRNQPSFGKRDRLVSGIERINNQDRFGERQFKEEFSDESLFGEDRIEDLIERKSVLASNPGMG
jgi:hypothetical protein